MAQPRAYTPNHLAERILRSRSALEGERKPVTVLFVDVIDSVRLSERAGAEAWHRVLDRFFALLADAVHRFEGTINQYTGDGVMALFGAPIAHEDHAQRACHAALLIRAQLRGFAADLRRQLGLRFAIRTGLNSGEVIVGAIGDDLRMDYTAQGHTVGLAARMQQSANAGKIRLSEGTAALVAPYFELAPAGRTRLKGVRGFAKTFELAGPGANRTRIEASRARGFSRFVGRERELAALDAALARAADGDGGVLGVLGAPGVGKSRLCQHAAERWRAQGVAVAEARCPPHGKALPFAALLELLRSFLGVLDDERPATGRKKARDGLRTLRTAGPDDAALVLDFLGLGKDPSKAGRVDARPKRERLFALTCGLVQARSARSPTFLLFDDAQWMDAESEVFLGRLVDAVAFTRSLVVVNARPEYVAPWLTEPGRRIELAPLAAGESELLLRELIGDGPELAELRTRVAARAAGNPFFAEETVQSLFESGALVRDNGAVRIARPIEELELPVSVQALLAARIDALPGGAKHVLQLAAVIGKRFAEPVLRAALGEQAGELGEALRALQAAGLVHPESAEPSAPFTFTHPLTQEVAYAVQLQEARVERHRTVATALQSAYAQRLGEHAALVAHHWALAGNRSEAGRWRRLAALQVTNIQPRRELPPDARKRHR